MSQIESLRQWIRTQVAGQQSVRAPDLTDRAVEMLMAEPTAARDLLGELLRPIVYRVAISEFAKTRRIPPQVLGDDVVTQEEVERRAKQLERTWLNQWEHVGDHFVRIGAMTKDDLLVAATERRTRAATENERADLLERLANKLKEGEIVADRFTSEQIEALRHNAGITIKGKEKAAA